MYTYFLGLLFSRWSTICYRYSPNEQFTCNCLTLWPLYWIFRCVVMQWIPIFLGLFIEWIVIQLLSFIGFTPDVKVWEVVFDRSGQFKEVVRAFDLTGHSAGVYSFAFSGNSDRWVLSLSGWNIILCSLWLKTAVIKTG